MTFVLAYGFCACTAGMAQDLSFYTTTGRLVRQAGVGGGGRDSLLVYRKHGLVFHMWQGRAVSSIIVFRPEGQTARVPQQITGSDVVIPGISACGVSLGMSRDQVLASPFMRASKTQHEDNDSTMHQMAEGTTLLVIYSSGRVSQLQVLERFVTPSGVGSASSSTDVLRAYGPPDCRFSYERNQGVPWAIPVAALMPPAFGALTGLALRRMRMRVGEPYAGIPALAACGASGFAVSYVLAGALFCALMGVQGDWRTMAYGLSDAVLIGAGGVVMMECLPRRFRSSTALGVALIAVLSLSQLASVLLDAVIPGTLTVHSPASMITSKGLFMVAMFVGAGARGRTPGTNTLTDTYERRDQR